MRKYIFGMCTLALLQFSTARGQDNTGSPPAGSTQSAAVEAGGDAPVSRQEFNEMKKELTDLKKQQADQTANASQDADDFDKSLKAINDQIAKIHPGLESVVIAGDANVGFQTQRGSNSTFFADVSPLILWQPPNSKILIETAFDLGIGGADINSETSTLTVNLADISYELNDYCIVGGGLFAVPFGQYHNHYDPPWVNKFPDDPLAQDALGPTSEVGFYLRGAVPSGTTKWTYDFYVANGPNLITSDPNAAGQLNFDDFTDLNNNKALGGRIGFLPVPEMEMGYSIESAQVAGADNADVWALLQDVDISYKPTIKAIDGQIDVRAEWIWSHVSEATYDPTGALGFGPVTYGNNRSGGYVQFLYRPILSENKILRNVEMGVRYDGLFNPLNSPGGDTEQRLTFGVDYWVTSYFVVKAAYELDKKQLGQDQDSFLLQVGVGL
jgi:hypothetical protein